MTTLVSIKKEDKIILAADSRTTGDKYIFPVKASKIIDMGEWAIAFSGLAIYKDIVNKKKDALKKLYPKIDSANVLDFVASLYSNFYEYGIERIKRADDTYKYDLSGIIITSDGQMFYFNGEPDAIEHHEFCATGSGASYAEGALAILYHQEDTIEVIAEQTILVAANFDSSTDNNVSYILYNIDNEGKI